MQDTPITIALGTDTFTVLINECNDDSPWLARYGATKNGAPCDLEVVSDALAAHNDIPEGVLWNFDHENALEAAWDAILVPALATLRAATPRWPNVSCSSCGEEFGPGDSGFSHCEHHAHLVAR